MDSNQETVQEQVNKALAPGEKTRITIIENESGSLAIGVHAADKISTVYLIGLLTIAIGELTTQSKEEADQQQFVEIELDQWDFDNDKDGYLIQQGFEIGSRIKLPLTFAQNRDFMRGKTVNEEGDPALETEIIETNGSDIEEQSDVVDPNEQ